MRSWVAFEPRPDAWLREWDDPLGKEWNPRKEEMEYYDMDDSVVMNVPSTGLPRVEKENPQRWSGDTDWLWE